MVRGPIVLIIATIAVWLVVAVICVVAWQLTDQPPLTPVPVGTG